ncbi:MAG: GNAT family N-acetyltransferase [Chitinivibrionales bacterium]|nr:GNAT family N-acetyltransferase [Chitinivibrionales bacterium]
MVGKDSFGRRVIAEADAAVVAGACRSPTAITGVALGGSGIVSALVPTPGAVWAAHTNTRTTSVPRLGLFFSHMHVRTPTALSPPEPCPYLADRTMVLEYFFATRIDDEELDKLLAHGWRVFGQFYFRPACPLCRECVPLRVRARELVLSRSQRRIRNRNRDTNVRIGPPVFREEIYDVYRDHSVSKFGREPDPAEFFQSFYHPSCPSLQSEYFVAGELAAVGFLSRSVNALSSVYFVYRDRYRRYGLGVFSVIHECAYAAALGLEHYSLGYYISANKSMSYKGNFEPHERYNWSRDAWDAWRRADEITEVD